MTKPAHTPVVFAALTVAALAVSGCRTQDRYVDVGVVPDPGVDEAIVLRDWPQTRAEYASGDVIAGNLGFQWEVNEDLEEPGNAVVQVPTFIGNLIVLPVTYFTQDPTEKVVYVGEELPASFTANPPLPKRATLPPSAVEAPTTLPATAPTTAPGTQPATRPTTQPTTAPATLPDVDTDVPDPVPAAEVEAIPSEPRRETTPVAPMTPSAAEPATRPTTVPTTRPSTTPATQPADFQK
ncbi:MAG: hypothetical protein AAGD32_11110 [Planctomycetota bacterium]